MGQHDASGTNPDMSGGRGDRRRQYFRRRADDGRMVVMFGQPIPGVAKRVTALGQGQGGIDGTGLRSPGAGNRLVED